MLLTRQSQIAISLLVTCAQANGRYIHTYDAATGTGASKEHAAKVAHLLCRAGFVKSVRGRRGGIALARPAACISIGDVLRSMQPEIAGADRPKSVDQPSVTLLAGVIRAGWENFVDLMNRFTIDDLIAERPPQRAACKACPREQNAGAPQIASSLRAAIDNRDAHALSFVG